MMSMPSGRVAVLLAALPFPAMAQEAPPAARTEPLMWIQSALAPAGPHAEGVARLAWIMFGAGLAIFVIVLALLAFAASPAGRRRRWMTGDGFVFGFGAVFPVVSLAALLFYGVALSGRLAAPGPPVLRILVEGEQWWWRVSYVGPDGDVRLESANEIRIPTGRPVEFVLQTRDVIHSFWVPSLAGKLDMIPGRTNSYRFAASRPGIYRGQCAEFCGAQHALMAFYVVAMEKDEFEAWYARESRSADRPVVAIRARGADLFVSQGCGACHTVRGTQADGRLGPDLTHVGGRRSIAAGTLPTNVGTVAAWIASSQHLKPGNRMPSFEDLTGEDLRAVAAYLEGLK
jgi:cytochrome c oxidase subunit 2